MFFDRFSEKLGHAKVARNFLVVIAATLALNACSSPEQRVEKYMKEGDEYFEQGDYLRANLQYRNALKINEEYAPALQGLINIAEAQNEYETMFPLLQSLIRLQPENVDALVDIGNIYLLASDEQEAETAADKALAVEPNNVGARTLKASILFKIGDRANALEIANDVLKDDPANEGALSLIVANRIKQEDRQGALAILDEAIGNNPSQIILQMMRIEILSDLGRKAEVDRAFLGLIRENPDDVGYRQTYARALVRDGRFADARPILASVIKMVPEDLAAKTNLVRVDRVLGGDERALETYAGLMKTYADDQELKFSYGAFLRDTGRYGEAKEIYEPFMGRGIETAIRNRAMIDLAKVHILDGEPEKGRELIERVLEEDEVNTEALISRASLKINADQLDNAIIDLRTALGNEAENVNALMMLGAAFELKGDAELAEKQIVQAFNLSNAAPKIANAYAKMLIRKNEMARAEAILQESLSKAPNNPEGLQLLAATRLSQRNWAGSEEAARRLEELSGSDNAAIDRILGTAAIGEGDYATAISRLENANREEALSRESLSVLIGAYAEEGQTDRAESLLKELIVDNADSYDARVLLSRLYFQLGRNDDAETQLNEAIVGDPSRIEAYDYLYRYYLRSGRSAEAFALIYQGLQQYPDSYGLKIYEADSLLNTGRTQEAIALYEELRQRRPDDRLVANNLASLLADTRSDEQSLNRAVEIAQTIAGVQNPSFQDTLGWVYFKAGRLEEAKRVLETAVQDFPNNAVLRYHLGSLLLETNITEDARMHLNEALRLGGDGFRYTDQIKSLLKDA